VIANFTSANFGWLVNTGFDDRPIEGAVAPIGADSSWRGGIGLPTSDFNHQPPEAAAGPRRQGRSRIGPWNIERLSENGQLIVDTIGFVEHSYSFVDNWRTPHTKDLHMVGNLHVRLDERKTTHVPHVMM
jgi:hypothetical protein